MFLIIAALALVAVFLVRRFASTGTAVSSAAEILRHRYAKGEISQEQFEEMKRTLGG